MKLIYFSPVSWASFSQRPHKFVEWFHSRCGGEVLWVDPYPTRLPMLSDFRRIFIQEKNTSLAQPDWITVLQSRVLPIEPVPGSRQVNKLFWKKIIRSIEEFLRVGNPLIVIGKPSSLAIEVLDLHANVISYYDAMDDFPAFYKGMSRLSMATRESDLVSRVNRICVSSSALAEKFSVYKDKLVLALNACDTNVLPGLDENLKPGEVPVMGYVGMINHWFDWQLIFSLAESNPSYIIRLIGPVHEPPPGRLPKNIEMRPACDHVTAIKAMQEFSVGLIPFKKNKLTRSVDPIKYYEYRAIGLPVLSTRFGEMALRNEGQGVYFMDEGEDLGQVVDKVLAARKCTDEEIRQFRLLNSWSGRFDSLDILPGS